MADLAVAFRLALRELRGGLSGFYVFIACIALGVAAIAGVNSVSRALTQGLSAEGRDHPRRRHRVRAAAP